MLETPAAGKPRRGSSAIMKVVVPKSKQLHERDIFPAAEQGFMAHDKVNNV